MENLKSSVLSHVDTHTELPRSQTLLQSEKWHKQKKEADEEESPQTNRVFSTPSQEAADPNDRANYRCGVCFSDDGVHTDELTMQFTALRKSLKTMPEVNCFAMLRVAGPSPHHLPTTKHHLPRRPLGQLLRMQYDFLRTVRRRGPFQQAGLNKWDVVEGAKARNTKQERDNI